jgi:hypothetical protein
MPDFTNERQPRERVLPVLVDTRHPITPDGGRKLKDMDSALISNMTRQRIQDAVAAEHYAQRNLLIGRQFPAK